MVPVAVGTSDNGVAHWRPGCRGLAQGQTRLPAPPEQIQLPREFEDEGADTAVEVLVVGESSAAGVPYDWWMSIGHIVTWQLERLIPSSRFRLKILANSGDTLEKQHQRLAGLERRPDLVLIYSGHNEFSARFPWSRLTGHYADGNSRGLWDRMIQAAETGSPLCRWIREEINKCRVAIPPPPGANRSLVDEPVFTQAELDLLVSDFERRLDAMISFAEGVNALPILILPPANDFDYEPNRSYLPPQTTRSQREAFTREFLDAREREESKPEESLALYRSLLERNPGFAELHYRAARLLASRGSWEEAYQHAIAARDHDGMPQRCLTLFQDAYRRVAARHHCTLIDGQEYFHKIGEHGLLDDHLFHDGLHPSLRGQIALAQAVLQAIHDRQALGWPGAVPPPVIDPRECAEHFGLTPWAWEKICNVGIMFYDLTVGARYDPTERVAKRHRFGTALERIKAGERAEAVGLPNIGVPSRVPPVPEVVFIPPPLIETTQRIEAPENSFSPRPARQVLGEAK